MYFSASLLKLGNDSREVLFHRGRVVPHGCMLRQPYPQDKVMETSKKAIGTTHPAILSLLPPRRVATTAHNAHEDMLDPRCVSGQTSTKKGAAIEEIQLEVWSQSATRRSKRTCVLGRKACVRGLDFRRLP